MKKLLFILIFTSSCFGVDTVINSFSAGELSPFLEGRTDVQKYFSGCRTLENFIVLTHGGATKRPGTYYIATTKNSQKVRLVPFEYSTDQAYILEFGEQYIRFYMNGGQILSGSVPYEISTPYYASALSKLQFAQSADTLYVVEANYPPYKLTRAGHTDWTIAKIEFQRGPFLDRNIYEANTVTTTGDINTVGATVDLGASTSLWDVNHIGALWQIVHTVPSVVVEGTFTADGNSETVNVQLNQKYTWTTHGTWTGMMFLEKTYDNGINWLQVKSFDNKGESNILFNETETVTDAVYRVRMDNYVSGSGQYSLVVNTYEMEGVVEITAFTDSNQVTGIVKNALGGGAATKNWAEGAWSKKNGYPAAITFYEERFVLAGTRNNPQTLWFSVTNDWRNFLAGTNADSSLSYTIASDQMNVIRWLASQNALLVGTAGGEWKITLPTEDNASPACHRQSCYGSAALQPAIVNNVILYVQKQTRKVRELAYSFQDDSWVSPDLTILSEHITGRGISQIAFQKTPDPILWCVVDGNLANMTYNREQEVVAWQRQTFAGTVESIAVIPGVSEDEVWLEIKRRIDNSDKRYIERFMPRSWSDQKDIFFVDCGLSFDGGAVKTITNISKAALAIVTCASHGFSDGQQIRITGVSGMTQVNDKVFTVHNPSTNSFSLRDKTDTTDITSTAFSTYVSGGQVERVENHFTTLSHLEGQTVSITGDGGYYGTSKVAGGTITLDDFYNKVSAGLNYTAKLLPMKLEIPGSMTQTRTKKIEAVTIRFYKTLACKVGNSWTSWDNVVFRDMDSPLDSATPLFTGDKRILFSGGYSTIGNIYIQQDLPVPVTILCLYPELEIN